MLSLRARATSAAAILVLSALLSACGIGGDSSEQGSSDLVDTGQSQPAAGAAATATASRPSTRSSAATPEPGGAVAGVKVSSSQATVGNLAITLSVSPVRRMSPAGSASAGPTPQPQQSQGSQSQGGPAQQELVLGDEMLHVTKNLDAAQAPPPDPKDGQGDLVRHLDIQIKDKSTGQIIPYLSVTVDILRDGRPIRYDQVLVPAIPAGGQPDQLHYGNNVAFPGKGRYQLFVRMPGSAASGEGTPPYAQFDVSIE